jgi:hypothetical protein
VQAASVKAAAPASSFMGVVMSLSLSAFRRSG